jgi:predicted phosphodiesterase
MHLPRSRPQLATALTHLTAEKPELILHFGDITTPSTIETFEAIAPVRAVAGNNEGPDVERRNGRCTIVAIAGRTSA